MVKNHTGPRCRYCGGPIRKLTVSVYIRRGAGFSAQMNTARIRYAYQAVDLTTIAECRALTSEEVVSVHRSKDGRTIAYFTTWDRRSYIDPFFCTNKHARAFGYIAAQNGFVRPPLKLAGET